jgi:hypothetical protein
MRRSPPVDRAPAGRRRPAALLADALAEHAAVLGAAVCDAVAHERPTVALPVSEAALIGVHLRRAVCALDGIP